VAEGDYAPAEEPAVILIDEMLLRIIQSKGRFQPKFANDSSKSSAHTCKQGGSSLNVFGKSSHRGAKRNDFDGGFRSGKPDYDHRDTAPLL
jgi:hypothetical protein